MIDIIGVMQVLFNPLLDLFNIIQMIPLHDYVCLQRIAVFVQLLDMHMMHTLNLVYLFS